MTINSLPAKQLAQVQGQTLEYMMSGSGQPVIVLVNGAGGPLEGWYKIYPQLAELTTVFAYNRPGVGKSDRPMVPQTGKEIVNTLHQLLSTVGLKPPYILVGHSLGGFYVNLYAHQFPDDVAGVVFLDAAAPGDEILQQQHRTLPQRVLNSLFTVPIRIFGKDTNAEIEFVAETVNQIKNAGPFPDIPVKVISGGERPPSLLMSDTAWQIRQANQKLLVGLSKQGEQIIAAESGHFPQMTQPDLVVQVIRRMLGEV